MDWLTYPNGGVVLLMFSSFEIILEIDNIILFQ